MVMERDGRDEGEGIGCLLLAASATCSITRRNVTRHQNNAASPPQKKKADKSHTTKGHALCYWNEAVPCGPALKCDLGRIAVVFV